MCCLIERRPARSTRPATLFPYPMTFRSKRLAQRPINTPVPAPQGNMLRHVIDRLAARAQLASYPFRQLRAIHPLHAVISKMDQDLRTMPSCCPTGKVITGYLASLDTELLGQIREAIGRD